MFAYNQLSDLKDETLVIPLRKNGKNIECRLEDGTEALYTFDDFDFDKTIGERNIIEVEIPEDTIERIIEIKPTDISLSFNTNDYVFHMVNKRSDLGFRWIAERNKLIFSETIKI